MNKLTKRESASLKELIAGETDTSKDIETNKELLAIYEKIDGFTLKSIEDLDKNKLRELVYDLMRDGAKVQGMEVEEFCLRFHNLEW